MLLAALVASLGAWGCASSRSWGQGCPGIYSGLRYSSEIRREIPFDGKVFYVLDLPFSALADTLAVPFTAFADPVRPERGFPLGCRWARRS